MQEISSQPLRFIVVSEQNQQRLAFSDTIRSWGFDLVDCVSAAQLTDKHFKQKVDVWLVDSENDYEIIQSIEAKGVEVQSTKTKDVEKQNLEKQGFDKQTVTTATTQAEQTHEPSEPASMEAEPLATDDNEVNIKFKDETPKRVTLVGFAPAPYLNESQLYAKWQRQLKRKLAQMLMRPDLLDKIDEEKSVLRPWKYVVVLGASMGGPLAVKEFLDSLPEDLPIAILLAQHFNHNMLNSLPRVLNRHNKWRCEVVNSSQQLLAGRCLILPIDNSVVCDSNGRVILQKQAWQSMYQPSISHLLVNCSEAFGNHVINIIFSGMGNDGSSAATTVKRNGSTLWVQTPDSSTCPSQPQSIIDTGLADFIATPKELAEALITLCKTRRLPNGHAVV